jgi:hypothetical protein
LLSVARTRSEPRTSKDLRRPGRMRRPCAPSGQRRTDCGMSGVPAQTGRPRPLARDARPLQGPPRFRIQGPARARRAPPRAASGGRATIFLASSERMRCVRGSLARRRNLGRVCSVGEGRWASSPMPGAHDRVPGGVGADPERGLRTRPANRDSRGARTRAPRPRARRPEAYPVGRGKSPFPRNPSGERTSMACWRGGFAASPGMRGALRAERPSRERNPPLPMPGIPPNASRSRRTLGIPANRSSFCALPRPHAPNPTCLPSVPRSTSVRWPR